MSDNTLRTVGEAVALELDRGVYLLKLDGAAGNIGVQPLAHTLTLGWRAFGEQLHDEWRHRLRIIHTPCIRARVQGSKARVGVARSQSWGLPS